MLMDALVVVLYIVLIVFVISLIVFVIKLIDTLNRVNYLVDDVTKKAKSLDQLFNIIDFTTNKMNTIGNTIVTSITSVIKKIIGKKESEEEDYE